MSFNSSQHRRYTLNAEKMKKTSISSRIDRRGHLSPSAQNTVSAATMLVSNYLDWELRPRYESLKIQWNLF